VARHVATSRLPLYARRFALYAASDGEIDTGDLVDRLLERGRQVVLPVVLSDRLLAFYRYTPKTRLVRNRYGILEPDTRTTPSVAARTLDVVFMPLVAFDANGHRLGMGGGFYDATFGRLPRRPVLIGLAHALQRIDHLDAADWDIPLDAVVTETGIISFTPRGRRATRH
jgi:5-formyltetrahydrofolate cyclo-ligase